MLFDPVTTSLFDVFLIFVQHVEQRLLEVLQRSSLGQSETSRHAVDFVSQLLDFRCLHLKLAFERVVLLTQLLTSGILANMLRTDLLS